MIDHSLLVSTDFVENPVYEQIISDLQEKKFSVVDQFFDDNEVRELRNSLVEKHTFSKFQKAAIGNRTNETIQKAVRGDLIFWLDESLADSSEKSFFPK